MTREKTGNGPRLSRAPRVRGTNLPGSPRAPMPAARILQMLSDASSSYRTERVYRMNVTMHVQVPLHEREITFGTCLLTHESGVRRWFQKIERI